MIDIASPPSSRISWQTWLWMSIKYLLVFREIKQYLTLSASSFIASISFTIILVLPSALLSSSATLCTDVQEVLSSFRVIIFHSSTEKKHCMLPYHLPIPRDAPVMRQTLVPSSVGSSLAIFSSGAWSWEKVGLFATNASAQTATVRMKHRFILFQCAVTRC